MEQHSPEEFKRIIDEFSRDLAGKNLFPSNISLNWSPPPQPADVWGDVARAMKKIGESKVGIDLGEDDGFDPDLDLQAQLDMMRMINDAADSQVSTLDCDFYDGPLDGQTRTLPPEGGGKPQRHWAVPVMTPTNDWTNLGMDAPPAMDLARATTFQYERHTIDELTGHWQYWPYGHDFDS